MYAIGVITAFPPAPLQIPSHPIPTLSVRRPPRQRPGLTSRDDGTWRIMMVSTLTRMYVFFPPPKFRHASCHQLHLSVNECLFLCVCLTPFQRARTPAIPVSRLDDCILWALGRCCTCVRQSPRRLQGRSKVLDGLGGTLALWQHGSSLRPTVQQAHARSEQPTSAPSSSAPPFLPPHPLSLNAFPHPRCCVSWFCLVSCLRWCVQYGYVCTALRTVLRTRSATTTNR